MPFCLLIMAYGCASSEGGDRNEFPSPLPVGQIEASGVDEEPCGPGLLLDRPAIPSTDAPQMRLLCRNIWMVRRSRRSVRSGNLSQRLCFRRACRHEENRLEILGGCSGIVNGLGSLRNKHGDAHGSGPKAIKPKPRHAELAVNLAGTMAIFLIETYEANKN